MKSSHKIRAPRRLQHFLVIVILRTVDPNKGKSRFRLRADEARNSCAGEISPATNLPKTAFPRYMPMVGPSDDSASNLGIFILHLLFSG